MEAGVASTVLGVLHGPEGKTKVVFSGGLVLLNAAQTRRLINMLERQEDGVICEEGVDPNGEWPATRPIGGNRVFGDWGPTTIEPEDAA